MNLGNVKKMIEENEVVAIDLKYADLIGNWYHITFPPRRLEHVLKHGIPFDGSSIPGMKSVEAGDMVLITGPGNGNHGPVCKNPDPEDAELHL